MNNKVTRILIPFVAASALIGTGFGSWYFLSESTASDSLKASIQVTPINDDPEFGHFQFYLKNEKQGIDKAVYYDRNEVNLILDQKRGLYWSCEPEDDYTKYVHNVTIRFYVKEGYINSINPSLLKCNVTYTYPKAFDDLGYFRNYDTDLSAFTFKDRPMTTLHYYQSTDDTTNYEKEYGFVYYIYSLPRYVWNKKPQNREEYEKMKQDLAAVQDQIKFDIQVTYNNKAI